MNHDEDPAVTLILLLFTLFPVLAYPSHRTILGEGCYYLDHLNVQSQVAGVLDILHETYVSEIPK